MAGKHTTFKGMTLFTLHGERKYLSAAERTRFQDCLSVIDDPTERTFCEMIFWTGCRPSEALVMSVFNIDLSEKAAVIRSLKKRGALKGRHFRAVPLPGEFIERLDAVHGIGAAQGMDDPVHAPLLWGFGRTKGWRLMRSVMDAAEISGVRGCARGLRHTMGVNAAIKHVPEARLSMWLGHEDLETTAIYITATGPEDRAIARRMWQSGSQDEKERDAA